MRAKKRRHRLVSKLAAGVSLADALEHVGAHRAHFLAKSGASVETLAGADPGLFRGGVRAMIEAGTRSDALAATARGFRRHAHGTQRLLMRVGVSLIYPTAVAVVIALAGHSALDGLPTGPDAVGLVPYHPANLPIARIAWVIAAIGATYWLLALLHPRLLWSVPGLARLCRRSERAAVAGVACELVKSGLDPDDAVETAASSLQIELAVVRADLPISATALAMIAAHGRAHTDSGIDRLRAALRLFGVLAIAGLILLYARGLGVF